jgi:hypothetical protein
MNRFIVKTLQIDCVRAVHGDFAVFDVPCQGTDQPEILVFVITGPPKLGKESEAAHFSRRKPAFQTRSLNTACTI